jgi:tetratricopeptide (TPR) repeat protein
LIEDILEKFDMHEELLTQIIRIEEVDRNFERAIDLLKHLVWKDPTCIEAYVHLAADFGILGNYPQAEQYARNALNLDQKYGRARYYLACALRDQGKLDEAYIEMEQALVLVKKAAVKGTGAEANWESFPLFGWNRKVQDDAINLHAQIIRRNIEEYRQKIGLSLHNILNRIGIGRK